MFYVICSAAEQHQMLSVQCVLQCVAHVLSILCSYFELRIDFSCDYFSNISSNFDCVVILRCHGLETHNKMC